jgi:hypothetical protein
MTPTNGDRRTSIVYRSCRPRPSYRLQSLTTMTRTTFQCSPIVLLWRRGAIVFKCCVNRFSSSPNVVLNVSHWWMETMVAQLCREHGTTLKKTWTLGELRAAL